MSTNTERLKSTNFVTGLLIKPIAGKSGIRAPAIELALLRAESWAELPAASFGTRGGSNSPEAIEERQEAERVIRMAAKAARRIPEITKELERLSSELYDHVQRLTAVVDPAKYDKPIDPHCKSCARTEGKDAAKIGGHWAPIYDRVPLMELCHFCYCHALATSALLAGELTPADKKTWPPVKACDLMHTQSAQAAGRWMSKQEANVA